MAGSINAGSTKFQMQFPCEVGSSDGSDGVAISESGRHLTQHITPSRKLTGLLAGNPHEQPLWEGAGNGSRLTQIPRKSLTRQLLFKAQNMIIPLWSEHQRAEASKYSSTSSSVFPLVSGRSKAATKKYTTVNQENKKNMDE